MNKLLKKIIKPLVTRVVPKNIIIWKTYHLSGEYIALTFDDGPDPSFTDDILNILSDYKVPATFFLIGSKIEKYPQLALKIKNSGHEIGNHSYSHNNYSKSKLVNAAEEIDKAQDTIRSLLGLEAALFRPPYGILSPGILKHCFRKNLTVAMWSADTRDHAVRSVSELWEKISSIGIGEGDIILMHDSNHNTSKILPEMIGQLKKQGLEFLTISELLKIR